MAQEDRAQLEFKKVPLVWTEPSAPVPANQVIVQYDGSLVYITFGQASLPLIWGDTDEEREQQLERIDRIEVTSVVRLAIAPGNFRAIADALQRHLSLIDAINKSLPQPT